MEHVTREQSETLILKAAQLFEQGLTSEEIYVRLMASACGWLLPKGISHDRIEAEVRSIIPVVATYFKEEA